MNCGRIVHFMIRSFLQSNYQSQKTITFDPAKDSTYAYGHVTVEANHYFCLQQTTTYEKQRKSVSSTRGFKPSTDPKDRQPDREVSGGLKIKFIFGASILSFHCFLLYRTPRTITYGPFIWVRHLFTSSPSGASWGAKISLINYFLP